MTTHVTLATGGARALQVWVGFDVARLAGRRWLRDRLLRPDDGGVSVIAGIAALTIGVLTAAGIVVAVMIDHANAVPGPGGIGNGGADPGAGN